MTTGEIMSGCFIQIVLNFHADYCHLANESQ